ncbi:hypothetical protein K5D33_15135 [Pseudomonas cichorii]|nr:hypothetical protein [Pseudomonas cichorii]MBX8536031.1 hypothetical protein [Pseudomonas cichorii]MBX8561492.1 hypothetical protein [Pseudomonas cichorii]MBX8599226.1 hypothetical protein [Pseudomonas cichorii]
MGFLAFLSGYIVSLEDRFQRDGKFCPFSIRTNLQASPKARKGLTWFGLSLWVVAAIAYLLVQQEPISSRDSWKTLGIVFLFWCFMVMGHCRELEFKKTGASPASYHFMNHVSAHEWPAILLKATLDIGKILGFFALMYALKLVINR